MSEHESLDELFRRAVTFPGPSIPLSALRTALGAVEEELAHAQSQTTLRQKARHGRDASTLHPEDRDLDLLELKLTVEQTLPRVFRGGFILTLWSAFEVVTKRMAEYAARQRRDEIASSQWKQKAGETLLDVLERVYSNKLNVAAFPDKKQREQLDQLRYLRIALIHYHGSIDGLPEAMRAGSKEGYEALGLNYFEELHESIVIPTAGFLREHFGAVEMHLNSLAERTYAAAHP